MLLLGVMIMQRCNNLSHRLSTLIISWWSWRLHARFGPDRQWQCHCSL